MKTSNYLTLGEAARTVGKSKATISNYINSGKLAVIQRDKSGFKIDPAELFRVFPSNSEQKRLTEQSERQNPEIELFTLRAKMEAAEQRIADKDREINDLRKRLDLESEERRKLTLMLMSPPAKEAPPAPKKSSWWRRYWKGEE